MIKYSYILALALIGNLSFVSGLKASIIAADFNTYLNGNLVGQNGWDQYNTQSTTPLQVSGGSVSWSGIVANDQDAYIPFASQILQPSSGTTTFYFGLQLKIGSAPTAAVPSYFAALNTFNDGTVTNNFQNARLAVQDNGSGTGFSFGIRVNGQAGYAFAFGSTLTYGTTYNLIARIDSVAGAQNDVITLFLNPSSSDFSTETAYATSVYGTGAATDPDYGGVLLSQFGTATVPSASVSIDQLMVSTDSSEVFSAFAVPEPSTYALVGFGLVGLIVLRRLKPKSKV